MNWKSFRPKSLDFLVSLSVLAVLLFYTYAFIFNQPYLGFAFDSNVITSVFVYPTSGDNLQVGDKILLYEGAEWQSYINRRLSNQWRLIPGESILLTIQRDQQELQVNWRFPEFNWSEFYSRLAMTPLVILPFIFAAAGMITLFYLRPKDQLRNLLAAFFFLTAIWITTGTVSSVNIYYGSDLFHTAIWISWPVAWHLNWLFPKPLRTIPTAGWILLYTFACLLAVADALRWFPINVYPIPLMLAGIGIIVLQFLHYIFQPDQRRQVLQFLSFAIIAIIPGLIYIPAAAEMKGIPLVGYLAIIPLGLLPLAYIYPIYHRQLGERELRANRVITVLAYCVIITTFSSLIALTEVNFAKILSFPQATGTIIVVFVGLIALALYPTFHRWFEGRILGMPIPPTKLLSTYTGRIATSLDMDRLTQIFGEEILPSMLIRQAALLRLEEANTSPIQRKITPIYTLNAPSNLLPSAQDIPALVGRACYYYPPPEHPSAVPCTWARLVLPLKVEQRLIGLCLLGRRDPDDYYAPTELSTLQALMDQTALALVNIDQAQQLHAIYRQDIEREERERSRMALDLHDDVLNQMALLAQTIDPSQASPQFSAAYQASVQHIREIITGLRPQLLNFGLKTALDGLADDILPATSQNLAVHLDLPPNTLRYPEEVELHLYRIVQQACQNAIQHGQAHQIHIYGSLRPEQVELTVEDDGVGFDAHRGRDLAWLLANQQFGLAGMYERAALINATLQLDSAPGSGTRVKVVWQAHHRTEVQEIDF